MPRPRRGQTGEARRSWSRSGGPRRASTAPCRSSRATRSASSSRRGLSSPSRATVTSTTRTARRCPSRSPRTSATAPTPSAVEVTIDSPEASGVLFSQGSRFGGHALYMKAGKFKYVYNWVGEFEQIIESTEAIPTGRSRAVRLLREGRRRDADRGNADALHRTTRRSARGRSRPSPASSRSRAKG